MHYSNSSQGHLETLALTSCDPLLPPQPHLKSTALGQWSSWEEGHISFAWEAALLLKWLSNFLPLNFTRIRVS
jgi:hypothetical protein